jgi:hypothetical protein
MRSEFAQPLSTSEIVTEAYRQAVEWKAAGKTPSEVLMMLDVARPPLMPDWVDVVNEAIRAMIAASAALKAKPEN